MSRRWIKVAIAAGGLVASISLFVFGGVFYLRPDTETVMRPALDRLSKVPQHEQWSSRDLQKVRELGPKAIPLLRSVVREPSEASTRFLLWVKGKWPKFAKRYRFFADADRLKRRQVTACQVLSSLGPAAKPALPDIIATLDANDFESANAATLALMSIGMDRDACERLDTFLERNVTNSMSSMFIHMLSGTKPASPQTVRVLLAFLGSPSLDLQSSAASVIGHLGINTPEVIAALQHLQQTSVPKLTISASGALWDIQGKKEFVIEPLMKALESELEQIKAQPASVNAMNFASEHEINVLNAAAVLRRFPLDEDDRRKVLSKLDPYAENCSRMEVRLHLLRIMVEYGYRPEKAVVICMSALKDGNVTHRTEAIDLLKQIVETNAVVDINVEPFLRDKEAIVRIDAARIYWLKTRDAKRVIPILTKALDSTKNQTPSNLFVGIEQVALKVLGEMGPAASPAISAIEPMERDPNPDTAKAASEALRKIRR